MTHPTLITLAILITALLATPVPAAAQQPDTERAGKGGSADPVAATQADRVWSGAVTVAPGNNIRMVFKLVVGDDGGPVGLLSIPAQGVVDAEVIELKLVDGSVSFVLAFPGLAAEMRPRFDLEIDAKGSLAGTMTQAGMEFVASFESSSDEALDAAREASRPQTPKGPFAYRTEEVTVPVQTDKWDHTLAGTLTLPDAGEFGEGPYPTVIFITGSGAQDRDETIFEHKPFAVIADYFATHGIASLRCDDRGVFGSTGDPVNPTTHNFVDDARAQVGFLAGHDAVGPIGVIGHSEGGVVGPMIAADDDRVKFVVMLAGTGVPGNEVLVEQTAAILAASGYDDELVSKAKRIQTELLKRVKEGESIRDLRDLVGDQIRAMAPMELTPELLNPAVDAAIAQFEIPWMLAFIRLDPRDALRRVTQPVLVLSGDMDLQVLSWQNVPEIEKALADNPDVTVRVFEGLNHMFQRCEYGTVSEYNELTTTVEPEVLELVTEWVLERGGD
ncbi:MAG: pimeloyl-ACP methyl ester carboxylesterase [Phycisphaerales bacterium]|jgi:pimeloyl-ACP methyl ester carboxylesterase